MPRDTGLSAFPAEADRPARPIRVLVVDDEQLMRSGLGALLQLTDGIAVAAEAGDGQAAVAAAQRLRPDVVVMDLHMPLMDGVAATAALRAVPEPPAVLVLTSFDDTERVLEALRAGAAGYLLKSAAPSSLVDAVLAVSRGQGWIDPAVVPAVITAAAHTRGTLPDPLELRRLTAREREVLASMAGGWSNGEIAALLVLSEGTVKTHVSRIFAKLGLRDRSQAVALAYRSGLVALHSQVRRPEDP